jgi:hypothetical protein
MKSIRFPKQFKVFAPLIVVFLVLVFIIPKTTKFPYDYKKGSPWMNEDLVAQFDFPVLKSEAQLQQERDRASEQVLPYYRHDPEVSREAEKLLAALNMGRCTALKADLAAMLNKIYDKGVMSVQNNEENLSLVYIQRGKRA